MINPPTASYNGIKSQFIHNLCSPFGIQTLWLWLRETRDRIKKISCIWKTLGTTLESACVFYLSVLGTPGAMGVDVRGWAARVSASILIKSTDRSLTILLGILEAVNTDRESGKAISRKWVNVPLPASLPTGGRGTRLTVVRAENTSGVLAGNLEIGDIRC